MNKDTKASYCNSKPEVIPDSCGKCEHFTKTGWFERYIDRYKGRCTFYDMTVFVNDLCFAVHEEHRTKNIDEDSQALKNGRCQMEDIPESKTKTCVYANISIALLLITLLLFTYASLHHVSNTTIHSSISCVY